MSAGNPSPNARGAHSHELFLPFRPDAPALLVPARSRSPRQPRSVRSPSVRSSAEASVEQGRPAPTCSSAPTTTTPTTPRSKPGRHREATSRQHRPPPRRRRRTCSSVAPATTCSSARNTGRPHRRPRGRHRPDPELRRVFGGFGNDINIWAPGDGSDLFDGEAGQDTMVLSQVVNDAGEVSLSTSTAVRSRRSRSTTGRSSRARSSARRRPTA